MVSHGLKGMMASVSLRQIHCREETVFVNIGRMIILSKNVHGKGNVNWEIFIADLFGLQQCKNCKFFIKIEK